MGGKTTTSTLASAVIATGRILDVNCEDYTVSVATEYAKKPQMGISFATPYQHPENGEGIYFMPEVGSVCWLCFPSDGSKAFVLAWASAQTDRSFRSKKVQLNPGDIYLGTRDENHLTLRRGGVVQIGATALAQRIYMPLNNVINDFCENYNLHTPNGDLIWTLARLESDKDGKRPSLLRLQAMRMADDEGPSAILQIGSHGSDEKTILSLVILDPSTNKSKAQISLKMDKEGTVTWEIEKDFTQTVKGKYTVTVTKALSIEGKDTVTVKAGGKTTVDSKGAMVLKSGSTVDVKGTMITLDSNSRKLGSGSSYPPLLADSALLSWLAGHMHPTTSPGAPTGPPTLPKPLTPQVGWNTLIE